MKFPKKKILIIEDEKILAEMYQEKFSQVGFDVDLVFNAEDGISSLSKKVPDLILLDILLPDADGIQFLRQLRNTYSSLQIPIVAFSNYDDPLTKKEAFLLGVKDYLIKTKFTPKELVEKIKKYLESA